MFGQGRGGIYRRSSAASRNASRHVYADFLRRRASPVWFCMYALLSGYSIIVLGLLSHFPARLNVNPESRQLIASLGELVFSNNSPRPALSTCSCRQAFRRQFNTPKHSAARLLARNDSIKPVKTTAADAPRFSQASSLCSAPFLILFCSGHSPLHPVSDPLALRPVPDPSALRPVSDPSYLRFVSDPLALQSVPDRLSS